MRIAVLDDEEICLDRALKVISRYSRASGFDWTVHGFSSGEDLLRRLKRENFDLLIIDWYLSGMSGYALLCWVQEHLEVPPPVIVLTGGSARETSSRPLTLAPRTSSTSRSANTNCTHAFWW